MPPLRIGCVPYLNGVPLVAWFHDPSCDEQVELNYAVPSRLAVMLREGEIDVAMVSIFEWFRNPSLQIIPGISVSANGPVKSVRLFSSVPFDEINSVALDTSSLTSVALTRILLSELYGRHPQYVSHEPNLEAMLARAEAALIIGDLKMFDTPARYILDLGEAWKQLTDMPFVYAGWLAREDAPFEQATLALQKARDWGVAHYGQLAIESAKRLNLRLDMVEDYFYNVMQYDLPAYKTEAINEFKLRCKEHKIIER